MKEEGTIDNVKAKFKEGIPPGELERCGRTARRWTHSFGLQHSEGAHSVGHDTFFKLMEHLNALSGAFPVRFFRRMRRS